MDTAPSQLEEYAMALARERAAWEALRGSLPGSPSYDQERWQNWRKAVDEADRAAARARTTIAVASPAHHSLWFRKAGPATRLPAILGGSKRAGQA
jgi:hypothetical protein